MPRHFLSLADQTTEELVFILDLARQIKLFPPAFADACRGRTLAMIFFKPSLRTRVSFETGIHQLGGQGIFLGPKDIQIHQRETVTDTVRALSRYVDAIMARVFHHADLEEMARVSAVPVINGLSELYHPCQALADLQTIREKKNRLEGLKLAYVGDGNNVAHSLLYGGAHFGMTVSIAHPRGYAPDPTVLTRARDLAASRGGAIHVTEDPREGVADADVVYTDVWASMGQEDEREQRLKRFAGFQVNEELFSLARPNALFMHCLPAHRGEEVTDAVLEGPRSVVFDQAENRLHAQKALMVRLFAR